MPRYAVHATSDAGARETSCASWGAQPRHATVATPQATKFTDTAGDDRSAGFWITIASAYANAARMHSAAAQVADSPWRETPAAISPTPISETTHPPSTARERPSRSRTPARIASISGAVLTSSAEVPASIVRSAAFSATL
jgi:hypothetical protein